MKSTLTHRVSTILATTLATATLATGTATAAPLTLDPVATPTDSAPIADLVVPIPTGSAALDLAEAITTAGSSKLMTGSAVMSGIGQILCKMEGGTWIQGDNYSYCHIGGFNPG
ncbi:hypothetical protein [Nocardia tengchongensis]|uniref:hypothetical protein n=1 Tax=Nocardia tengchongensis TaxID=2055889 RepID=UPI00361ACE52